MKLQFVEQLVAQRIPFMLITECMQKWAVEWGIESKNELESLLETAGFSRDNPYYMVEQGSVKQLCELSDEGRLRLLKEVAGTRVYEERRRESENLLEDTKLKVSQIRDMIEEMNRSLKVILWKWIEYRNWRQRRKH